MELSTVPQNQLSKLMIREYNLETYWTIKTFLLGPTNYKGTRVKAILKRDSEEALE